MATMHKVEKALTYAETGFNVVGSIPVLGMFSGAARMTLGKVQFVAASVFAAVSLIAQAVTKDAAKKALWGQRFDKSVEHMAHGALNAIRGLAEAFLGWTVFGSIIPLGIQICSKEGFAPRFTYSSMQGRNVVKA